MIKSGLQVEVGNDGRHLDRPCRPVGPSEAMGVRDYDLQTQLGKGSQGVVWKAKRKADGVLVAIKQIMLRSMSRREQADAAQEVRTRRAANRTPRGRRRRAREHPASQRSMLASSGERGCSRARLPERVA